MKKKIFFQDKFYSFLIIGLFVSLFLFSNFKIVSAAGTYYVATNGNDANPGTLSQPWHTIQKAANTVTAGDTVYIRAGTYNEKVTMNNLQGTSGSWITFMPYNNEKVIVSGQGIPGNYDGVFLLKDGCKFIRISGLEIKNASYAGIFLLGGEITDIHIDHCIIHDCQESGIYAYSGNYGTKYVRRIEFDYNDVHDVHLAHNNQEAISFSGVLGFNIHHNNLTRYGKEGIDLKSGSRDGFVHHNTIDNTSTGTSTEHLKMCIYVDGMTRTDKNIYIYNNFLTGNSGPGIVLGPEEIGGALEDIWIYNNIIYLTSKSGAEQYRGIDCSIHESGYIDHKWTDIYIINNSIYSGSDQHIVRIVPSTVNMNNLVIANNIIAGTTYYQIYFQNMLPSDMPGKVTLTNNLYYRYGGTAHNKWESTENPTGGWGSNSVLADPKFIDLSASNLHLQSNSPAINQGSSVYTTSSDFDGNSRPQGSGYDIGAYEYLTSSSLSISFIPPTPANGATINQNQTTIAASVSPTTSQLSSFINWNQSLVGYWSLNEGTGLSALDSSTYGNNATLKNGVIWTTAGKFGKALQFDGINDYVSVLDSNSLDLTNALTVEAWVYPTAFSSYPRIISKESGSYAYPYVLEVVSNKATLYVKLQGSSSNEQLAAQAASNLPLNTWTHVVATWNGQVGRIYYNGVQSGSDTSLSGTLIQTTKPLLIGNSPNANRPWKGKIDEVRIWKRVLSVQEIKASYNTSLYNLSNTFTNLPNGTYQYYARTINTAGTISQTETRTLNVNKIAMIDSSQMLADILDAILRIQDQINQLKELIIK